MKNTSSDSLRRQLVEARESAGLTREQLAARVGLTVTQVSRIETGARSTTIQRASKWLVACGFTVERVDAGGAQRAALLATIVGDLDEGDLQAVGSLLRAWRRLPGSVRTAILTLAGPYADEEPVSDE